MLPLNPYEVKSELSDYLSDGSRSQDTEYAYQWGDAARVGILDSLASFVWLREVGRSVRSHAFAGVLIMLLP